MFKFWGCTYTLALPVMLEGLLRTQRELSLNLTPGQYFFAGGDSVSPSVKQSFEEEWMPVLEAYGATEVAPICWNSPAAGCAGSLGMPGKSIEIRLVDADGNPSDAGELCLRAPHLMTGYWQDPKATADAIRDGWFRTGDLARRDSNGFYHFAGRKKEIIIRGGSNVSPQEVEAVLHDHPAVAEVGVIGCPDAHWGEIVAAYIVLRPGRTASAAELIEFARQRLADYKTPEKITFLDQLPKSPSGKIQRRALREAERAAVLSHSI